MLVLTILIQMDEPLNPTIIYTHGCFKQTMDTHIEKITRRLAVLMDLLCNAMDQTTTRTINYNGQLIHSNGRTSQPDDYLCTWMFKTNHGHSHRKK